MKYRKILSRIVFISFFIGISFFTQAQEEYRKFKFGLKGSGNVGFNKTENKNMENGKIGIGYSYGLMMDYNFGKNYALNFGFDILSLNNKIQYIADTLQILSKTSSGTDTSLYFPASSTYSNNFGFVNIPISLKMSTNEIGYMKYFLNFGIDLGIRYRAKANVESTVSKPAGSTSVLVEDFDISNQTAFFRTALLIGGGFEYNIAGNTNLFVGISFSNGFSNIYTKNVKVNGEKVENRTITFDENGNLKTNANNEIQVDGEFKKAFSRMVSLNVGIFF